MRLAKSTFTITLGTLLVFFTACGQQMTNDSAPIRLKKNPNGSQSGATTNHPHTTPPTSSQNQTASNQQNPNQPTMPPVTSGSKPNSPIATAPVITPQNTDCYKSSAFICKIERLITDKTNKYRASRGLQPLSHDAKFSFVARDWSLKQARSGNISHNGFPNSREAVYRTEFGVSEDFNGENVAYTSMVGGGSSESDAAAEAVADEFAVMWWNSSGHRANMLGRFSLIGVGIYKTTGGAWYATQVFQ